MGLVYAISIVNLIFHVRLMSRGGKLPKVLCCSAAASKQMFDDFPPILTLLMDYCGAAPHPQTVLQAEMMLVNYEDEKLNTFTSRLVNFFSEAAGIPTTLADEQPYTYLLAVSGRADLTDEQKELIREARRKLGKMGRAAVIAAIVAETGWDEVTAKSEFDRSGWFATVASIAANLSISEEEAASLAAPSELGRRANEKRLGKSVPTWNEMFDDLLRFKTANSHCNVPTGHSCGRLGRWVLKQRKDLGKVKRSVDEHGNMLTQERIRLLDEIDFQWTVGKGQGSRAKIDPGNCKFLDIANSKSKPKCKHMDGEMRCTKVAKVRGFCQSHNPNKKLCKHKDASGPCTNLVKSKGFCHRHKP